jgi:hypothetical protein
MNTRDPREDRLLAVMSEGRRLKDLSTEDLIREYRARPDDDDGELHVEEMMTRLWPAWAEENV